MRNVAALVLVLGFAEVWGIGAASAGEIYCNNQGRDCSDRPAPGATSVRTIQNSPPAYSPSAPEAASSVANGTNTAKPGSSPTPIDAAADERLQQEASRLALQKDVTATRATQCKDAKERYTKTIEARRVYRTNKAGEREYLSDAETDQERLNARLDMDKVCK